MLLIGSGNKFISDLEKSGALGIKVPPEGGSESHYRRRLRGAGYTVMTMSAKGLGELSSFLTRPHGVRPPHLGKHTVGHTACVGDVYYFPPLIEQYGANLPAGSKGLVFWFYEGHVFSEQERSYLVKLSQQQKNVKFVVEVSRDRYVHWGPLQTINA